VVDPTRQRTDVNKWKEYLIKLLLKQTLQFIYKTVSSYGKQEQHLWPRKLQTIYCICVNRYE
jgi:hypothetical protein